MAATILSRWGLAAAAPSISKHSCVPVSHDLCTQQHLQGTTSAADMYTHRLLQMVCELLLERGDYVLAEEYTYPSVIESVMIPKGYKPLGVKLDQDGILPESLLEVCC